MILYIRTLIILFFCGFLYGYDARKYLDGLEKNYIEKIESPLHDESKSDEKFEKDYKKQLEQVKNDKGVTRRQVKNALNDSIKTQEQKLQENWVKKIKEKEEILSKIIYNNLIGKEEVVQRDSRIFDGYDFLNQYVGENGE